MKTNQKSFFLLLCMVAIFSLSVACSSASTSSTTTTPTGQATLTGTLYQPNGTDPLPGALLYVTASSSSTSLVKALQVPSTRVGNFGNFLTVGTDCDSVPTDVTVAGSTCTDADGTFAFDIADCSTITLTDSQVTINYKKGSTISGTFTTTLTCSDSGTSNTVAADDATISGDSANLKIAVCSGAYDQMENVLARMGFAPSDTDSDGTEDLDGWDGTVTQNFNYFRGETGADEDFPSCCDLLQGESVAITDADGNPVVDDDGAAIVRTLSDYDIAFLNCGSGCESGGFTTVIEDVLADPDSQTTIQNFVNDGGAFYVTDLSYDFVEQSFPGEVDFAEGGNGSTAETEQEAQVGVNGSSAFEPLSATVNEDTLKNYLSSVTAGNTDCGIPTGTGALNDDESVFLCDFLSSWAVMIGLETASTTTNWIQGEAEFSGGPYTNAASETVTSGTTEIPLTVGFTSGDGAVLYTSYHTDNSSTVTTEFLPQERVLQFLILDLLGRI